MMRHQTRALTLIETLVSISIIGVTLGMAAAFIKYHEPAIKLHGAARELRSELLEARSRTVSLQATYGVVLHVDDNAYDVAAIGGTPVVLKSIALPEGISFAAAGPFTNDTVYFNAAGAAYQGGTITLQNTQGNTKQVTINPSGYVAIEE